MKRPAIPACFYPTTVVLIDDDLAYLHNLRIGLPADQAIYKLFDNPKRALQYLNHQYEPDPFIQRVIERPEDNERGHHSLDVNVYPIREEVYNPKRFEQISMVVTDQEMPGLKGLELCRALRDLGPVKKLMLTGEVDDGQAIEAFNEGLIQQFINKRDREFSKRTSSAILHLQRHYFNDLSTMVIDGMVKDPSRNGVCCLIDPAFIEFFDALCLQHQICEFYLTDEHGSFMLVDVYGKPSILAVKDSQEMAAVYLTAQMADNPPSDVVLSKLSDNTLILYTHTDDESYIEPSAWQTKGLLHPAHAIKGEQATYHYAHITDTSAYEIHAENILSFREYLERVAAS
jgi:CheY-like chemotaxis protein